MHLGMWRRTGVCWTSEDSCGTDKWAGEAGALVLKKRKEKKRKEQMSSETSGGKEGQLSGTQPRMRLDLPPGGFRRPDGRPAAPSSA